MNKRVVSLIVVALVLSVAAPSFATTIAINFQDSSVTTPAGYEADEALLYGDRGNGLSYGWDNWDGIGGRVRGYLPDVRYDTFVHFAPVDLAVGRTWEIGLDNGTYDLWVVCGDPEYSDTINSLDIEGVLALDTDGKDRLDEYMLQVEVLDGRLTIAPHNLTGDENYVGTNAFNPKIDFVEITPVPEPATIMLLGLGGLALIRKKR